MNSICIIPARGGSKRIPRKNIRDFLGRPIIAYSIDAAITSGVFDDVIVSTDDPEIADVAMSYGAKVPFMRSEHASDDDATTADVLVEVIERLGSFGKTYELLCCLYATAPFVEEKDFIDSYSILRSDDDIDTVLPIVRFDYPPQRSLIMCSDGIVRFANPSMELIRSQDLDSLYHDAGQFYFMRTDTFYTSKRIIGERTYGIVKSDLFVQDIDDEDDWALAEVKYRLARNR